jgi:hypothetical protein
VQHWRSSHGLVWIAQCVRDLMCVRVPRRALWLDSGNNRKNLGDLNSCQTPKYGGPIGLVHVGIKHKRQSFRGHISALRSVAVASFARLFLIPFRRGGVKENFYQWDLRGFMMANHDERSQFPPLKVSRTRQPYGGSSAGWLRSEFQGS